ncbi:MAG TPA: histidine kinase dimerization/phospho-acceptor domain-containing protein, partial [Aggregatilineales bacterium]|nr:histidine kinase dimerization/phospho-acceptor domain-containing protein [Aggregatilineales bacterium]
MKNWKAFVAPSVYWRILGSFALIIVLMMLVAAFTYVRLLAIRTLMNQAVPTSAFTVELRLYASAVSKLDSDLQRYFVVGGSEVQDAIATDLDDMQKVFDNVPQNLLPQYLPAVEQLRNTTTQLRNSLPGLLSMDATKTDSMTMNRAILNNVNLIDSAKQIEQKLSTTILADLDGVIVGQTDTVAVTVNALIGATVIALFVGVIASLVVSRSIVNPLSHMAAAAAQIAAGKLNVRVPVHSRDEPGQLAADFNAMADQLQKSLKNLQEANSSLKVSNQELRIATAEAKEASRLKDEFLSIMSHELRTPLNAIIGFLGIMNMTGNLDERNKHMVQRIRANSERLLALINDVLDISRIEAGRLQLFPAELSVDKLTQQIQNNMSILAEQKGLKFTIDVDSSLPPTISVDQDAINKIITNLLSNAFKFTDQGEVALS